MNLVFEMMLLAAAALVALPITVLFIECMAALFVRSAPKDGNAELPPKIGVLISAHNEELLIDATVRSIINQLRSGDELMVVADNCDDRTAELACAAGATVVERHDLSLRGKGYGLNYGVQHIRAAPPDVLILFDADMSVKPDVIGILAAQAWRLGRPIQAQYILEAPRNAGPKGTISTLAFIVKNAVRPAGLDHMGIPCSLTGSGMAFPWPLIEKAPIASGHLVEDMELGLHFLRAGVGPKFCSAVTIKGELPTDSRTAYVQRTRWEHGHLAIIRAHVLPLLLLGMRRLRMDLFISALDLAVPPLALLVGCWGITATTTFGFALLRHLWAPACLSFISGMMMVLAIASAWRQHASHLPARAVLSVPAYVFWKIPLYLRFLIRRQTTWVRTSRESTSAAKGATPA